MRVERRKEGRRRSRRSREEEKEQKRRELSVLAVPLELRTLTQISRLTAISGRKSFFDLPLFLALFARGNLEGPCTCLSFILCLPVALKVPSSAGLLIQWIQVHASVWRLLACSALFYAKVGLGSEVDPQLPEDSWFFGLQDNVGVF